MVTDEPGGGGVSGQVTATSNDDWFAEFTELIEDLLTSPDLVASGLLRRAALAHLGSMVTDGLERNEPPRV